MSITEFELTDKVMYVKGVGPRRAEAMEKLGIVTKYDLLTHYPRSYENHTSLTKIDDIFEDETVLVVGRIFDITSREARGLTIINATLADDTGYIRLTWFNQKYLLTKLKRGMRLLVIGKAKYDSWSGGLNISQIQNFTILEPDEEPELGIMPVYPSTATISQNVLRTAMKNLLASMPPLKEILPQKIIDAQHLIPLDTAMRTIHFPTDNFALDAARRRQCAKRFTKKFPRTNSISLSGRTR